MNHHAAKHRPAPARPKLSVVTRALRVGVEHSAVVLERIVPHGVQSDRLMAGGSLGYGRSERCRAAQSLTRVGVTDDTEAKRRRPSTVERKLEVREGCRPL